MIRFIIISCLLPGCILCMLRLKENANHGHGNMVHLLPSLMLVTAQKQIATKRHPKEQNKRTREVRTRVRHHEWKRTRSVRKQSMASPLGLAKMRQEFFFVSSFVRFLADAWTMFLCLCSLRSSCRKLNLIALFYILFQPYAYSYVQVWTMV